MNRDRWEGTMAKKFRDLMAKLPAERRAPILKAYLGGTAMSLFGF